MQAQILKSVNLVVNLNVCREVVRVSIALVLLKICNRVLRSVRILGVSPRRIAEVCRNDVLPVAAQPLVRLAVVHYRACRIH